MCAFYYVSIVMLFPDIIFSLLICVSVYWFSRKISFNTLRTVLAIFERKIMSLGHHLRYLRHLVCIVLTITNRDPSDLTKGIRQTQALSLLPDSSPPSTWAQPGWSICEHFWLAI